MTVVLFLGSAIELRNTYRESHDCVTIMPMSQTYKPKRAKRARTHGFIARSSTPGGRKTLQRRRSKGRGRIAVQKRRK